MLAAAPQARGSEVETFRAEVVLGVDAEVEAQLQGLKKIYRFYTKALCHDQGVESLFF